MGGAGQMKIGVIGAGAVGGACLLSSILRGVAREIVVVNRDRKRAKGVVADLQHGGALSSVVEVRVGEYADLAGAALIMITAGMNDKTGGRPIATIRQAGSSGSRRTRPCTSRFFPSSPGRPRTR